MFGDDPDPSVTTARFGCGAVFGRAQEGFDKTPWREGVFDGLRKEREESGPVDLRGVNTTRKKRQLRANASFMETMTATSADAM